MILEARQIAASRTAQACAVSIMPDELAPWIPSLVDQVTDAAISAADRVLEEPETVEQIAAESWDAIIDGAAPWAEQDADTKVLHTATVMAIIAAFTSSGAQ